MSNSLSHIKATIKSGTEPFTYNGDRVDFTLLHFWQWSVSDILSNATRGKLAEFIVAKATNINTDFVREEWADYDLLTPDRIKLEVKSAAYLQSWNQRELSKISFSIKAAYGWNDSDYKRAPIAIRHADVYVFCLLKHEDKPTVNPLNLDQWEFYVLSTRELESYSMRIKRITLKALKQLTQLTDFSGLNERIKKVALNDNKLALHLL